MINHELKCIFVHIQRTGGTSIESWIAGDDWWEINPQTKHVIASQARKIYNEYWDDYFKFSFVRNPISRVQSCLKYRDHFGLSINNGKINFERYHELFGDTVIVEYDYRFYNRDEVLNACHSAGSVYKNILDVDLDFIGRFETIMDDTEAIGRILGKKNVFNHHLERSDFPASVIDISKESVEYIKYIYRNDISIFGY